MIVLGLLRRRTAARCGERTAESGPVAGLFGLGVSVRGVREGDGDERQDALATAAIFLGVGVWLILLGVVVDRASTWSEGRIRAPRRVAH